MTTNLFDDLEHIAERPQPFACYTAADLWTDEHTVKQMLAFHLDGEVDLSSRRTEFIDRSVAWIVSRFGVGRETRIADFGCGPGLYTTRLARAQAVVTGIDFSPSSIAYARDVAREEGLDIEYVQQDYLALATDERFDLIIMIMCDYCALSPRQRRRMLTKFRSLLRPNGRVVFDIYTLKAFDERREESHYEVNLLNGFWAPGRYHGFLHTYKYEKEKVILDKYSIYEAHRSRTVYNWLQYFAVEDIERELLECGLCVEDTHADVAGTPYDPQGKEMAIVAKTSQS